MTRTYQSEAQKKLVKRRKTAETSRNSQRLCSWLIQRETPKHRDGLATAKQVTSVSCISDDNDYITQNLGTDTISVDFVLETSDTYMYNKANVSPNDDFPAIIANSQIKKAIIAANFKQPKGPFPKDPLQNARLFSANHYHLCNTIRSKTTTILVMSSSIDRVYCQPCWLLSHENASPGTSYALQNPYRVQQV